MNETMTLPVVTPGSSLQSYIAQVNSVPMLSAEEERALARRFREQGDLEAARALVLSHLRFVVRVASGYAGYGLPLGDLIQEGNIGLMKAVKRFDPDFGVRLVSFAVHWIRAEIHEFILRNWRIVKVATTKAQRKLFFNLRSAKKRLGWMNRAEVEAVAEDLGVSPEAVEEMDKRLGAHDAAFDTERDDDGPAAPVAYLADLRYEPEEQVAEEQIEAERRRAMAEALATLDPRSRDIVESRWLREPKLTLQELADRHGVSAERIRQIEKAALGRLRAAMADQVEALAAA